MVFLFSAEQFAIETVLAYEKKQGRKPEDLSKKKAGFDIISGKRRIEVKGHTANHIPSFIWINRTILKKLGKNVANYYVYIVYGLKTKKSKMVIIPPEKIFAHLEIDPLLLLHPRQIVKEEKLLPIEIKR